MPPCTARFRPAPADRAVALPEEWRATQGSLNFSIEAGALIAGISLSMSPFRYEISSKLKPLRDFFILLFFVVLGSQMVFSSVSSMIVPIIIFSFFILIGNPLIVMIIMGLMGYTKRNALFTGLAMAQISEFSLIVVALGVKIGHISGEVLSFVTIIGIITIAGSSYYMLYNDRIYNYIYKYLRIFERKGRKIDEHKYYQKDKYSILLFGYHRIGFDLVETFKKMKKSFMVIDSNPDKVIELAKQGVDCRYGDADDIEFLNELNIKETKMIVSTIPDLDTNLLLIKIAKELNKDSIIIVVSNHFDNSVRLYEAGADYVIMPHLLGGKHTSLMIQKNGFDAKKFMKEKLMHLGHMEKRKNLLKRGD